MDLILSACLLCCAALCASSKILTCWVERKPLIHTMRSQVENKSQISVRKFIDDGYTLMEILKCVVESRVNILFAVCHEKRGKNPLCKVNR